MNPVLEGKNEMALEGLITTLTAVDVIFETLLDEIQHQSRKIEWEHNFIGTSAPERTTVLTSQLVRLVVQKQTIEALREGIPEVILNGDPHTIARIVRVG